MTSQLHRKTDPETSRLAAAAIEPQLNSLQEIVLYALKFCPMTDEELRDLPVFRKFSDSTARGRRSELTEMELVEDSGVRRKNRRGNLMIVWKITTEGNAILKEVSA